MARFRVCAMDISRLKSVFLLVFFVAAINGQRENDLTGLFPVVFNLATRARISANATCGEHNPETFCKLVEHVELNPAERPHCDICYARSNIPSQRHNIHNAVDGSQKWWQSPSLANGPEYNHVSIVLELGQIYQVAYVIVKAANSPRPGNWILERSLDGVNYKPWQYFAMTDQECRNAYGVEPTIGHPVFLTDDQVICVSSYSALNPLEGGEVVISLVNGRPGVFKPSKVLLSFTSAKFIRLRFQKIRTLHADLMSFKGINANNRDFSVTRRYFYSVKDISIGGHCICYGHASYCGRHPTQQDRLQCQCLHNTGGDNCESCMPRFNQKPWQVGGIQNIGCEECNCHGKADACVYNATVDALRMSLNMFGQYEGGGVCMNCREHTTGVNCEMCEAGYFRRPGITPELPRPCQRCSCVETATSTNQCITEDTWMVQGVRAGDCICKEGFAGRSCNKCADGYYGFPRCRKCLCNHAGSLDPETCNLPCSCKDNVAGSRCDQCLPGHFNLDKENVFGCTECFCFGVSRSCDSVPWGSSQINDVNGWELSTLRPGGLTLLPRQFDGWLEAKTYLLRMDNPDSRPYSQDDVHYWNAPMTYLGNRLSSYGGSLDYTIKYIIDSSIRSQYHLREPNVVLEGMNISVTTNKEYMRALIEHNKPIPLHEDYWFRLESGEPATRGDLMMILYNLKRLLIRATYHTAQSTVYLKDVNLDTATPLMMDSSSLLLVEQCRCPSGYAGLSCESCLPGWRRVNNQLYRGRCEKCQCNNHSTDCDPYTGQCLDCKHSTTGKNCNQCLPGFYGDPRKGTQDDCKPCACPLVSGNNFFADRCIARPTLTDSENYECVNCQEGYTGIHCQECAPGFYGDPSIPGGFCRRCSCGGNIQVGVVDNCDKKTGVCNKCSNNTEGTYCERCSRGYYGSAVNGDCRPCECSAGGSASSECDPRTGQCQCRGIYAGRKCDRCENGYGDYKAGCRPCGCNKEGSTRELCNPITGDCSCQPGVSGTNCDKCTPGHYGFSRFGCRDCGCFGPGTNNSNDCNPISGRCVCKQNVNGKKCDQCMARHFGLLSGNGCAPCDCDRIGSYDAKCSQSTGQCKCKNGAGGIRCNHCLPGYYGFSKTGCRRCEPCPKKGHICDAITGKCICPPNTEGPNCEKCIKNCWGHNKNNGCKENVMGQNCDQCRLGTFSLDRGNPKGCTECYCFLRGKSCYQAPYVWNKIELTEMIADLSSNSTEGKPLEDINGYMTIKDSVTYVPNAFSYKPVYWNLMFGLPKDLVLSYNGKLSFIHEFQGEINGPMIPAPLVVLMGNGFVIETGRKRLEPNKRLQYNIPLHENAWTLPGQQSPIERRLMMVVLQKLEKILVLAAQDGKATSAELSAISLETAVPTGPNITSTKVAFGVEVCDCPKQFSGESCQNPAKGFYRVLPDLNENNLVTPEVVIGSVKKCQCFSHSMDCHPETGICQNCQHNTTGDKCELCSPGFYGVATTGNPDDCKPCACPLEEPSNNFSPNCTGGKNGMMCTACQEGYNGDQCEKCAPGYYGDPNKLGDSCKSCDCNPQGSVNNLCDSTTGQCSCVSNVDGQKCDQCKDVDSQVVNGKCVSCFEGCTGILLDDLANMTVPTKLGAINISFADFPWNKLYAIEREANELRDKLADAESANIKDLDDYKEKAKLYKDLADKLFSKTNVACPDKNTETLACKTKEKTESILKEAQDLEKEVNSTFKDIKDMIQGLDELVERLLYNHTGINMTDALAKAKDILEEIENRNFTDQDDKTRAENKLAEELSDNITAITAQANNSISDVEDLLNDINNRLEDLSNQTNSSDATVQEALDTIDEIRNLLIRLKSIKDEIEKTNKESIDYIDDSKILLEKADENLALTQGSSGVLDEAIDELLKRVKHYENEKKKLNQSYEDVIDHVKELMKRAAELEKLFAKTRNISGDAVKAANAYKSIVDAIKEANKSANNALKNAQESVDIAKVSDLEKEVEALMNKSRQQLNESEALLKNASAVAMKLDDINKNLTDSEKLYNEANETAEELKKKLDQLPKDIDQKLKDINATNKDTLDTIDEALKIVDNFNSSMAKKLKEIEDFDIDSFNFNVSIAKTEADMRQKKDVQKILNDEKKLEDKAQKALRKTSEITTDLDRLKEKIRDARSRVNEMKLSLTADGSCHRSYRSQLSPSSTNEITFGFRLNNESTSDMLIALFQQSQKEGGKEFLAAEIKDNKVRFSWDSGKGQGSVSHPQTLVEDKWYQVIAKRIGSVGQLKVWDIEDSSEKRTKMEKAAIGAGCSLMNLNKDSMILLAGSSDLSPIPLGITRNNFRGCLGNVQIDSSRLGVYNFKTDEPDHCKSCVEVPEVEVIGSKIHVFSGYGFAQFPVNSYNPTETKVEFLFKTFYENAQLFFMGNPDVGDFVSIQLRDGYIYVIFHNGHISTAEGNSTGVYYDNKWCKVVFHRRKLTAVLSINNGFEKITMNANPGANSVELQGSPMLFGGLPSKFKTDKFKGLKTGNNFFYGCMKGLTFEGLAVEGGKLVNVEISSSCRDNGVHNVAFKGDGYLIMPKDNIEFSEQKNDISLTFVSTKKNGVLMVARDIAGENYYSISLVDGKLYASMKSNTTTPVIFQSQDTFNDGKMHCVSLVKDGRTTTLTVDDKHLETGDSRDITGLEELYIGGLPTDGGDIVPTNKKMDGCISDIIANGVLLSMANSEQHKRADVGRCKYTDNYPPATLADERAVQDVTTASPPEDTTDSMTTKSPECATFDNPEVEANAKSVANTKSFYAEISKLKKRELVRDLNISVEFRTYYPDGVFGYLLNDAKDTYFGIQLKEGKVQVKYNYNSKLVQIDLTTVVNDGKWHKMTVEKVAKELTVKVDDEPSQSEPIPNKLDVVLPLYVGGQDQPGDFAAYGIQLIEHSIRGCIRNFFVVNKDINMDDHNVVSDIGQCYKDVEAGIHFGGDAWGSVRKTFEILEKYEMSLDFRTHKRNGILLSTVSTDEKSGLTVELHDGKLKLSILQDSQLATVETSNTDLTEYCDNAWHQVALNYEGKDLVIVVDGNRNSETAPFTIRQVKIDKPLYFGGYPNAAESKSSLQSGYFHGCIRNVAMNKQTIDWYNDVVDSRNIRRTACPT